MTKPADHFKVTVFEAKTLSWWRARRTKIDMEPPYQRRGHLWSQADKAYLIDSILNGFDIPKLYIADFTWSNSRLNERRLPYAIIDGKQRLEAIFDFYDGLVVLNDDFTYRANPGVKLAGLGYKDLLANHAEVAEEFDNYNLSVMSVVAHSVEPIHELFVRLNRSKPLTGAEVRNAMSGPAPEIFRRIAEHTFFSDNVAFAVKRGQDLNAAAKLVMFEYNGEVSDTKKRNLDGFVASAAKSDRNRFELAARRVVDVLDIMTSIFLPRDRLLQSSGVVPTYYWFLRSVPERRHRFVREFLWEFERMRKENRQLSEVKPRSRQIVRELVEFDNFNRNTNDQLSHKGRSAILETRFATFMRSRRSSTGGQ